MKTIVKKFETFQRPLGFKRYLTDNETEKMYNHFSEYSWSIFIDSVGNIILGNGYDSGGFCYITEEDLRDLE